MTGSPRPARGVLLGPLTVAVLLGAIAAAALWLVGMSLGFALSIAVLVVGAGLAWAGFSGSGIRSTASMSTSPRPGTRGDVSQLSWSMHSRDSRVSTLAVSRLRAFARRRLRRVGLDLDDPADQTAIRALVGTAACGILMTTGRPTLRAVERCLDALDAIWSEEKGSAPT